MVESFGAKDIASQAKEWTKEDVIEQIKTCQFGDEFFLEERISGDTSLHDQIKASRENLEIIIEFINTRCID